MTTRQTGFTIIEIMIVIAIIGIALAFAIPMYQDYSTRTRFTECLNLQAPSKLKLSEYVISNASMPGGDEVPLSRTTEYCDRGSYVRHDADTSMLVIGLKEAASGVNEPGTVVEARLEARRCPNNDVEFSCYYASSGGDTTQGRYLPSSCRTTSVEFSAACF